MANEFSYSLIIRNRMVDQALFTIISNTKDWL